MESGLECDISAEDLEVDSLDREGSAGTHTSSSSSSGDSEATLEASAASLQGTMAVKACCTEAWQA